MEREVWSEECGEWSVEYGVGIVDLSTIYTCTNTDTIMN